MPFVWTSEVIMPTTTFSQANRTALMLVVALTVALLAQALGVSRGHAEDAPKTYVIGVEDINYLPAYGIENGHYVGYARAILDAFAKDQGILFDYRPMPVRRLYGNLAAGAIDFKFPDNPNWNVKFRDTNTVVYSHPVIRYMDASVVRADRTDMTVDQVHTLATVTGFSPWPWVNRIKDGTVQVSENADLVALVRQVLAGRVDAAYVNIAVVNRILDKNLNQPGALTAAPAIPHDSGAYVLSTIHHQELIATFDAWMANNEATLSSLKEDYAVERGVHDQE